MSEDKKAVAESKLSLSE
jgi:hypothetical protein